MKTKHYILVLTYVLTFFSFSATAQEKSLYYEGFSSGSSWPKGSNDTRTFEVKNGKYYFEHKRENKNWNIRTPDIAFDTQKDFEIETKIQRIFGKKSNAFGLLFGAKDADNTFHFVLGSSKYRISKKVDGKFIKLKDWTTSSSINQDYYSYNKLRVKKSGKRISFYINDDFVASMDFEPFFGNAIGILVYNKQKVTVDYFKATQKSTKKSTSTATKTILFEGFNSSSNSNNWDLSNSSDASVKIQSGDLIINHKKSSGGWAPTISKYIDTSRDFRITGRFNKMSGVQNNGYGLAFGRKDSQNQNQFFISPSGSYIISKHVNGKRTYIKNWTKSSHIKTGNGARNNLKVQKKGSAYKFYINSNLVYTSYSTKFYGDRIGFIVYDKQKIAVEYLSMYYDDNAPITNTTTTDNVLWSDDFNSNNKNDWSTINNENAQLEIRNGKYYFEHKRNSAGWSTTKKISIDTDKDFKIDSRILKINGPKTAGFGFTFGRKDSKNQFIFTINSQGSYSIDEYTDGKFKSIKKWTKSSHIKQGNYATNTLTIKKERGYLKFYVNDRYLTLFTYKPFKGSRFGFIVYENQKIAVDDLKIKYINQKTVIKNTTPKKNENIVATGEYALQEYFNSNKNIWSVGSNDDKTTSVANSYFNFEYKKKSGGWSTYITSKIDTSRDFEISSLIKKVSGVTNYAYGMLWGKSGTSSFRFYISSSGYYKISRLVDNKEEIIKKFTKTSAIKTGNGATNLLTINKVGNKYKFYANGTYLTQSDFEPFFGNQIGYSVFNQQKISADRLIVKYLKKKKDAIVTSNILNTPLSESFSGNTNGWYLTDNTDKKTRISNGKLYIKNKNSSSGAFISKKIDIDTSRDFIIETSITRLTDANSSIAIAFGRKNNTNEFDLFLSKDSYLFRKLENDTSTKLIPWTTSNLLNKKTYQANKIKIVKSNSLLRFYINDQYVNEAPYTPFFGKYFGFSVYNKQEVSIDYINVSYPTASFNTPPEVVIIEPIVQRGFKIVKTKRILVRGKATDKDGIFEITINGIDATIAENGSFTARVPLKIGTNDLVVKATDLKQASSTKTFTIKRKSPDVINNDDVVVVNKDKDLNIGFGEYYALLIGVSDYGDGAIQDLGGLPTKDAKDLGKILIDKYNFKSENVIILNNSPKANDIIKEFSKLKKKVGKKDNLLVFYAGHGVYDEVSQVGHWLPSDADMEYELNLISNSQVVDFLKAIQTKHTLLISDACFSGSIFKTRSFKSSPKSIQKKYELTSRKAITSGTLKTVPNKSMFLKYLLNRLENNTNKYLSARQLFNKIEEPVMNNSPNTPQYGTIYGIGDEGGDFIFIKN